MKPPAPSPAEEPAKPDPSGRGTVSASGKFMPNADSEQGPKVLDAPLSKDPAEQLKKAGELVSKNPDGTVSIGRVRLDTAAKSLSFPAKVNAREGPMEYVLVTPLGKAHESIFTTEADPLHVHLAALLMGFLRENPSAKPQVSVEVEWKTNGPARRFPLSDLVALAKDSPQGPTGSTLAPGAWDYSGSTITRGQFMAGAEGSLISLIGDPSALVSNPREDRKDDSIHIPNAALLPPLNFPVTIHIKLLSP